MHYFNQIIKKYPFSVLCIAIIWVLSLMPFFPETPFDDIKFIDKWIHFVMYGGTGCVIWAEYLYRHRAPEYWKPLAWGWVALIVMSGILELLQAYCTGGHRNGDWLDFAANSVGATLAAILGLLATRCVRNKKKEPVPNE